ncbi:DUF4179 domain-containing protein [Paenibacillus herberti]|uniref:DUF4179 domain-containing protein n=1 Tax=Paenibacillus herberti TaxID=1619309 RepID=A0A229NWV6_9BACL|nr:DUF4179 domain-containing protein [Paenibacillus herberti]OXM14099.1 hypothetical protein CGZ75_14040 [Paenibacillus herberti]
MEERPEGNKLNDPKRQNNRQKTEASQLQGDQLELSGIEERRNQRDAGVSQAPTLEGTQSDDVQDDQEDVSELELRLSRLGAGLMGDPDSDPELERRADAAIAAGLVAGKRRKRNTRRLRRTAASMAASFLVIALCLATIRVSPAFASVVRQIPGMASVVDIIREQYDNNQTVQDAVDYGFMQQIGVSDEHDGLKLTVEGLIADDYRIMLVYTVEGLKAGEPLGSLGTTFTDSAGRQVGGGYGSSYDSTEGTKRQQTIEILLAKGEQLPDWLNMEVKLNGFLYKVGFPVDRELFAGKSRTVALDQTIEVEGQKLRFTSARISPLTVAIEAEYAEGNSMRMFGPVDMKLSDETGTDWGGVSYSMGELSGNKVRFEFQSPYFRQPKELYLSGTAFRAQDKNNSQIILDAEKGVLLKAPDDRVQLTSSSVGKNGMDLRFSLRVDREDPLNYTLLNDFTDATGKLYEGMSTQGGSSSTDENNLQKSNYSFKSGDYKQPLTFEVYQYPNFIDGQYRVRIPLGDADGTSSGKSH